VRTDLVAFVLSDPERWQPRLGRLRRMSACGRRYQEREVQPLLEYNDGVCPQVPNAGNGGIMHSRPATSLGGALSHGRTPCADLRTARGAELVQDVRYVGRDRLGGEHELFGDLPVGEARRDKLGDLELALA
jgi:hypothetical protein